MKMKDQLWKKLEEVEEGQEDQGAEMVGQGVPISATTATKKVITPKTAINLQEDVNPEVPMEDASYVMKRATRKQTAHKEEMVVEEEITTDEADHHQGGTEAEAEADQTEEEGK